MAFQPLIDSAAKCELPPKRVAGGRGALDQHSDNFFTSGGAAGQAQGPRERAPRRSTAVQWPCAAGPAPPLRLSEPKASGHLPRRLSSGHQAAPTLDPSAQLVGAGSCQHGLGSEPPTAGCAREDGHSVQNLCRPREQATGGKTRFVFRTYFSSFFTFSCGKI